MSNDPINTSKVPILPADTQAIGIFQADIIIRTALVLALKDMREHPWLLDFVFASLPRDSRTAATYGQKEVARAKEWFTTHQIEVMLGMRQADGAPPPFAISIHLLSSNEEENTLADIHHDTIEEMEANWLPITPKFSPAAYSALTGVFKFPANIVEELVPSPFMSIVDRYGNVYPIEEVVDDDEVKLEIGTVADFTNCFVKPSIPAFIASLESAEFKESFGIGCHAVGEPVHLTYLHSIVVFAILRYRQALLEARGFQRSSISSSDIKLADVFEDAPEAYFSRYIQLNGSVRHVWPKNVSDRVLSVSAEIAPTDTQTDAEIAFFDTMDGIGTVLP